VTKPSPDTKASVSAGTPLNPRRRAGRPRLADAGDGLESRERILHESAKLFVALGYRATTTREIADVVGVRQSSLFHHYARKEDILIALLDRALDGVLDVSRWMKPISPPTDVALWALIQHDTYTLCADPLNLGALIRLPEVRSPTFEAVWAKRAELATAYQALIQAGLSNGSFQGRDAGVTANLLFSLSEGTIDWYVRDGALAPQVVAGDVADGALRMILAKPSRLPAIVRHGEQLLTAFRARDERPR
jgi:AcrR family transcriptional regulator